MLVLALVVLAVPVSAVEGLLFQRVDQGRAWFEATDGCDRLELVIVATEEQVRFLNDRGGPVQYGSLYGELKIFNTCAPGGETLVDRREGATWFDLSVLEIVRLESVEMTKAVEVDLRSAELGYVTRLVVDLSWVATSDPYVWIVHNGTLVPSPGGGPGPGDHHAERYTEAAVTGTVRNEGTGDVLFDESDILFAEIGDLQRAIVEP